MTPRERLGKRLFVILATVIVLSKLGAALTGVLYGSGGVEWHQLVLAPSFETLVVVAAGLLQHWSVALGLAVAVPFLWRGNDLLRRVVGIACVLVGGATMFLFAREVSEFGLYFAVEHAHGLVDMFTGLALLFLPSLRDFFHYQRAIRETGVASSRGSMLAHQPEALPLPITGGMWGAILGAASGFALSTWLDLIGLGFAIQVTHGLLNVESVVSMLPVASMLAAMVAGGLLGLVVGVVVGMVRPKPEHSLWRVTVTRGLVAAAVCVIGMTLLAGTLAALSGERVAPIFGPPEPGLATGALVALLWLVTMGPPLGIAVFVLSAAVGLVIRDG